MSLLSKFIALFKTSAASLAGEKKKILGVFSKTLSDLQDLHAKHAEHHDKLGIKIANLESEKTLVASSKAATLKVISKIEDFLDI